ncbi:MAG TPA: PepSY-like domain-containing protein [Flavitalea sp.]|nr:PepSY-like domain-containing protein [Flavitalea sp.]
MKKIIYIAGLFITFTILTTSSSAQLRKIPAEVTNAFQEKYPEAKSVEWRDKLSSFTASFQLDSTTYLAQFSNKGEWENTEEAIDESELPEEVKNGFGKSRYTDWNMGRVTKIQLPNDELQYRLEVAKGDIKKRNLFFNEEGRMLKDKLTL